MGPLGREDATLAGVAMTDRSAPLPPNNGGVQGTPPLLGGRGALGAPAAVPCPFCGSGDTEPISLFGSQLLVDQHRCRSCQTYFEAIRDDR